MLDKFSFLTASLLVFLRGGVAGLGLAAGAEPSLLSSSSNKLNVGVRWQLWIVVTLCSVSRSKRASGALEAANFALSPSPFRSKACLYHAAASRSSIS